MNPNEARLVLNTVLMILALVALRLIAAAYTPITFDEAYYWMWSKSLAGGYYDHPPMVAFVIRLGTLIAGDTAFGVRLVSILLALPMSWAVYEATAILFGSRRAAATSAILLNVTLMAAVGTMIVTPEAPLLVSSSFVLFSLAKVLESGRGAWWLAVGVAAGAALLSKYTALFFGPAILIWLIVVPKLRRWLLSPWLYLGGLVAAAMFAPVVLWNADHFRRSLLLDVVEQPRRGLLRPSADGRLRDPRRHDDFGRYRTRRKAGLDPAGAADELCGVSCRSHPVR